ncbi:MAG: transcription elongation factor GreA [Lachnospiraceae bacterium]|nr:transcription elongation factor GreA [Candidatus Darwinimomas equi]
MGEKLTQADIEKIQAEIEHRKLVDRPALIAAVKEARAQGDLSENFEYYAAKREKNQNEGRIAYLERMLKFAEVIEDESDNDEVGLNKLVEIHFEDENETETYKIVTPIRGQSLEGRVSIESPLGKALLGHKSGEKVFVEVSPENGYYVSIVSITPDDADDDIRAF